MIKFAVIFIFALFSAIINAQTVSQYIIFQALNVNVGKTIELHNEVGPHDKNQKGIFQYGWKVFERDGVKYLQLSNVKPEVAKTFNQQILGKNEIMSFKPPTNHVPYAGYAPDAKYFVIVPIKFLEVLLSEIEEENKKLSKSNKLSNT